MKKLVLSIIKIVAITGITVALGEVTGKVLLNRELKNNSEAKIIYEYVFNTGAAPGQADSLSYLEHHYLNYTLNPQVKRDGKEQYNADYGIRRSVAPAPRETIAWRGLALGGSTTFGEGVKEEEATWVGTAEKLLRGSKNGGLEFINGGIPGYTLQENFIHYTSLLTHLRPDVVVLYVGINDVHPRFFGTIKADYSNYRRPWRSEGQVFRKTIPWLTPSSLYKLYYVRSQRAQGLHIGTLVSYPYPRHDQWQAGLDRNSSGIFEENLRNFVRLIVAQNRKVMIVPQVFLSQGGSDDTFARGVQEHNLVAEKIARETNVPYVHEVLTPQRFAREDFIDNSHFNERGSQKFGTIVHQALVAHNLV